MEDLQGKQLGNYRLVRLIGKGSFAHVYLSEHIHLGTQAAIKVLHTSLTTEDQERFLSEARTIAHLRHLHIVSVLEFGVQDASPFLVMEYAASGSLHEYLPKNVPLPSKTILPYVKQVAAALQYAHDQDVIHRDVKPENMLLGSNKEVLLGDFGLATLASEALAHSQHDQGIIKTAGTVFYMAPEQFQGHPCPASDQYALGIVVYEWLTGVKPFSGDNELGIAMQHISTPLLSLRERVAVISPDVEQVVMTSLAKNPKDRFRNIQAFATAFENAVEATAKSFETVAISYNDSLQMADATVAASWSQFFPSSPLTVDFAQIPVIEGPSGRTMLGETLLTIGRGSENQMWLTDTQASQRHALIHRDGERYSLVDLKSTNGTFVNKQQLQSGISFLLKPDDTILIGNTVFLYKHISKKEISLSDKSASDQTVAISSAKISYDGLLSDNQLGLVSSSQPVVSTSNVSHVTLPDTVVPTQQVNMTPITSHNVAVLTPSIKGKRRRWIIPGLFCVLLSIVSGITAYNIYTATLPTSTGTLDGFCNAVQNGNVQTAYNQLSESYQRDFSKDQFTSEVAQINKCTYTVAQEIGSNVVADLSFTRSDGKAVNYTASLFKESDGLWKLYQFVSIPNTTLDTLCAALQSSPQDYTTAYNQLSDTIKVISSPSKFEADFSSFISCSHTFPVAVGNVETATMTFYDNTSAQYVFLIVLIRDGSTWKIDRFNRV